METKSNSVTGLFNPVLLLAIIISCLPLKIMGQYSRNPLLDITNEGYSLNIEKVVQIPDDDGDRPRINCLTFMDERIFASTETGGKIYEIINDGTGYHAELFFNVKEAIPVNTGRELSATSNWHSGLRSVAFHPEFQNNGKFYTSLMEERPADTSDHHYLSDVSNPIEADGVVLEWTYDFEAESVDINSYRELFRVGVPQYDHPMKQIAFNPYAQSGDEDYGLLYIGHGDGNLYNAPENGGQFNDARGKILRIDPLQTVSTSYSIPPSNPFVNDTSWLDEIFATGFRNPHSLCFARDASGNIHLISGNAGRDNIEEINVVTKGENYGWSLREGTYVQLSQGGMNSGIQALPDNEAEYGFTFPAAQWSHLDPLFSEFGGLSIVGGYVYSIEETGTKIFLSADFPQSGMVMYNYLDSLLETVTKLAPDDPLRDDPEELTQTPFHLFNLYFDDDGDTLTPAVAKENMLDIINDEPDFDGSNRSDLRFGRDKEENIYITSKRNGWIYKVQSIKTGSPVSITDLISVDGTQIKIFPNPVKSLNSFNITFSEPLMETAGINLISTDGRILLSQFASKGESGHQIDLKSFTLEPGYYLIRVKTGTSTYVSPIIIQ